jgi:histone H3/H4
MMTEIFWSPEAIEALRCASEDHLVRLLESTSRIAVHRDITSGIQPKDMSLAQRAREL